MKLVNEIDNNGHIINSTVVEDDYTPPNANFIVGSVTGFHKPKWDFINKKWIEELSQEELDAIKNVVQPPTLEVRISAVEKALLSL